MKNEDPHATWKGVFAATLCPFREDESVDEDGLRTYIRRLARVDGLKGLVPNGHTGEIMSLRAPERARVTQVVAEEVRAAGGRLRVVSGVSAEGSLEAVEHARAAQAAGADAILLMPPHHWLRFGRSAAEAIGFVEDVAAAGVDLILHQYPAWTKAGYSLAEMRAMVQHPRVVCIKMGTREMSRWLYDYEELKRERPDLSILTCHDEYLLPTLCEAGDGALIGFAGFAPELMVAMVEACLEGDLRKAKEAQRLVAPLAKMIYRFGEPGGGAHQRMKVALWLLGLFPSPVFRRPVRPLAEAQVAELRDALVKLELRVVR